MGQSTTPTAASTPMRLPSFAERLLTLLRRVMPRSLALRVYLLYSISLATFAVATVLMFYRFQFTSLVNEVNQDATLTIDLVSESVTSSAIPGTRLADTCTQPHPL